MDDVSNPFERINHLLNLGKARAGDLRRNGVLLNEDEAVVIGESLIEIGKTLAHLLISKKAADETNEIQEGWMQMVIDGEVTLTKKGS